MFDPKIAVIRRVSRLLFSLFYVFPCFQSQINIFLGCGGGGGGGVEGERCIGDGCGRRDHKHDARR